MAKAIRLLPLQKYLRYLRILLISRGYFRNWFPAGLRYFLYSKGLLEVNVIDVKCKDGSITHLPPKLYELLLSGLLDGLFKDLNCKDGVAVARGFVIPFRELLVSECALDALGYGWKYKEDYGYWFKNNVRFRHMHWPILGVFDWGEYDALNVKNKVIVNIGAFVGDSSIYFALRGAKRVIAIEPHPEAFKEMLENIRLNNLENMIIPVNAGLASKPGRICIRDVDVVHTEGAYYRLSECNSKIPAITLGELIDKYSIDNNAVLKMDCEGCEYDVILNDYEHVRVFDEVYFEYHAYITKISIDLLLKKLSRDFVCKIVSDNEFYKRLGFNKRLLGLIKCTKNR
jgi:FkbM family methyltransferase